MIVQHWCQTTDICTITPHLWALFTYSSGAAYIKCFPSSPLRFLKYLFYLILIIQSQQLFK